MQNNTNEAINYSDFVRQLKKPGIAILNSLTPQKADAIHMALGIAGEAGELVDAVKRWAIYNKDVDKANVVEELGDLMFFIEGMCQAVNITIGDCVEANKAKLQKRYSEGNYSDKQAIERKDKIDETKQQ